MSARSARAREYHHHLPPLVLMLLDIDQVDMDAATLARMSIANMLEDGGLREQDMLRNSNQTATRPVH